MGCLYIVIDPIQLPACFLFFFFLNTKKDFVNKVTKMKGDYCAVKELDINQVPSGEEEWTAGATVEEEEESSNGGPPRKKLRLTKEQSRLLEESFRQNHTLNPVKAPPSLFNRIYIYIY